jgi:hypothetical protein
MIWKIEARYPDGIWRQVGNGIAARVDAEAVALFQKRYSKHRGEMPVIWLELRAIREAA